MLTYNHTFDIPRDALYALEKALRRFAKSRNVNVDAWYHDMPIWLIRQTRGRSMVAVQIDAMVEVRIADRQEDSLIEPSTERRILSIAPILHEELILEDHGLTVQARRVPKSQSVYAGRATLTIDGEQYQAVDDNVILDVLTSVWSVAEHLSLDETIFLAVSDARATGA